MTAIDDPIATDEVAVAAPAGPAAIGAPRKRRFDLVGIIGPLVVFGLFIGLWYLAAYVFVPHNFADNGTVILVPPPHRLFDDMGHEWPNIFRHCGCRRARSSRVCSSRSCSASASPS